MNASKIRSLLLLFLFVAALIFAVYILWYKPVTTIFSAESLDLPPVQYTPPVTRSTTLPAEGSFLHPGAEQPEVPSLPVGKETPLPTAVPLCGTDTEWVVMAVGIDHTSPEYLYGLADVIRIVRIDFTKPQINVVSIPRALLVTPPDRLKVQGPLLLNQTYFFGAAGMDFYEGSGYGAGALAETLYYSFGIRPDHYLIVNFQAFVNFVDAIGGVDVNLPTYVDDRPNVYYSAGIHHLNGEQALELARIRKKYSDFTRIDNQTLILQAVLDRLKDPSIIAQLPDIYNALVGSVLTDLTPAQVNTLFCLQPSITSEQISFYNMPENLLDLDWVFIPTLNRQMDIYRWDQSVIDWLHHAIWAVPTQ